MLFYTSKSICFVENYEQSDMNLETVWSTNVFLEEKLQCSAGL